jgi:hypothetical protein
LTKKNKRNHSTLSFHCKVDGDVADEILVYNEILDHIERENNDLENDTNKSTNYVE